MQRLEEFDDAQLTTSHARGFSTPSTDSLEWTDLEAKNIRSSRKGRVSLMNDAVVRTRRKLGRIKTLGKRTRLKTKRVFKIDDTKERLQEEKGDLLHCIEENPTFNPELVLHTDSRTLGGSVQKLAKQVNHARHSIAHPIDAAKGKAASTLATSEQPFLSQDADSELLNAHNKLYDAKMPYTNEAGNQEHIDQLRSTVDDLEEEREMLKTAWTSTKFIQRARVVRSGQYALPRLSDYCIEGPNGKHGGYDWSRWIGHLFLYVNQGWAAPYIEGDEEPFFDQDITVNHVERIIVSSGPWQAWLLRLRSLSRWEEPSRSLRWLLAWLFIWYLNRVLTFIWCYIIYIVAKRKFRPNSRQSLQEAHQRTIGKGATAQKFGEMIDKHGRSSWLDPMLEYIGPSLQIQLKDLADFLEVLNNFYEWTVPLATLKTLSFFGFAIILSTFASADLCMRLMNLYAILMFFADRPISSRYPKYRHIVAPTRWLFWNIPTHSERAFRYLQEQAQAACRKSGVRRREENRPRKEFLDMSSNTTSEGTDMTGTQRRSCDSISTSKEELHLPRICKSASIAEESPDLFSARSIWKHTTGRLVIHEEGIRFIRTFPAAEIWRRAFDELLELRKSEATNFKSLKLKPLLEVEFVDGSSETLEMTEKRDEAFNIIIAFSQLAWQQLQAKSGYQGKTTGEVIKKKVGSMLLP